MVIKQLIRLTVFATPITEASLNATRNNGVSVRSLARDLVVWPLLDSNS
jgi:hypothetical protein